MEITFEMTIGTKPITLQELNDFQTVIGKPLPEDYRQHMLAFNGGGPDEYINAHISDPEGFGGILGFYSIKYASYTLEEVNETLEDEIPSGYLIIGRTRGGGEIIISLNNDSTYGHTKEWHEDGTINDLSPSFTQLILDQVEEVG